MAGIAADKVDVLGFVDRLAVFIKQKRAKVKGVDNVGDKRRKEANLSWARKYPIPVHGSIMTWKTKGDDGRQVQYEHQTMQCAFKWQKSEEG